MMKYMNIVGKGIGIFSVVYKSSVLSIYIQTQLYIPIISKELAENRSVSTATGTAIVADYEFNCCTLELLIDSIWLTNIVA